MRPIATIPVLSLALLLGAGCGGKTPPSHFYRLAPPGAGGGTVEAPPAPEGVRHLELGIPPFRVDPPYDGDQLVYRVGRESLEVGFRSSHRWAAPLSRLVPSLVADEIASVAGGFVTLGPPAGRPLDARLEGRVRALEEVATKDGAVALFTLSLTLRNRAGAAFWSQSVEAEVPVKGEEVADAVRAMQAAVVEAIGRARPALTGALLGYARATAPGG